MKNGLLGLFPKALTPLAFALLGFSSAVIHAAKPPGEEPGFALVFNRQNLKGWTLQARAVWQVENGELVGRQDPAEKEDSWLFSDAEWSDFALELEFKVPEKCNSGIALRMPRDARGSPDVHGYEVQISDLPARKLTGSLLHHTESKTNNLHKANEWNRLAVTCEDDHIVVYLNGLKVVDAKEKGSKKGRIGMQVPKGEEFAKQGVRFRNIRVKELKPKQAGTALDYQGRPWQGRPQAIPGPVFCAYYDIGGEGVAYHDSDAENQGSGKLNRADGSYLNEFRKGEGVDISHTKLTDLSKTGKFVWEDVEVQFREKGRESCQAAQRFSERFLSPTHASALKFFPEPLPDAVGFQIWIPGESAACAPPRWESASPSG